MKTEQDHGYKSMLHTVINTNILEMGPPMKVNILYTKVKMKNCMVSVLA